MIEDQTREDIAFIRRAIEEGGAYATASSPNMLVWGIAVAIGYLGTYGFVRGWSAGLAGGAVGRLPRPAVAVFAAPRRKGPRRPRGPGARSDGSCAGDVVVRLRRLSDDADGRGDGDR